MRKGMIVTVLMASLFAFGAASAQTDSGTDTGVDPGNNQPGITTQQDPLAPDNTGDTTGSEGGSNAGLWGLAGLLGLAGLMGRSKAAETTSYGAGTQRAA